MLIMRELLRVLFCQPVDPLKGGRMSRKVSFTWFMLGVLLFSACIRQPDDLASTATMPNPASVYCEQHGGTLAFRQDATGGVAGLCRFADGSECDEWAYYRGECKPGTPADAGTMRVTFPTPLPIDPADYAGWWQYANCSYGFTLRLPPGWAVAENTGGDPLLIDHLLNLYPLAPDQPLNIRLTYRHVGEDILLWPTGVGEGTFIAQGTLTIAGQPAERLLFVCPNGQIDAIWYHEQEGVANIRRGDLEFGFIFGYKGAHCQTGSSLSGQEQRVGEMIIASLTAP